MLKNLELLRAENVHLAIPSSGRTLLDIKKIGVEKGACVFVLGKNGAGKSTLLNVLGGFLPSPEARLFWKGALLRPVSERLLPGFPGIALVRQNPELDPFLKVRDLVERNIRHLGPSEKRKRESQILKISRMRAFLNSKVGDLSGGEKRRMALACVLALDPELVLLDEPFSDLDEQNRLIFHAMIHSEIRDNRRSFVVVSHNGNDAHWLADQIWTLESGRITERIVLQESGFIPTRHTTAFLLGWRNIFGRSDFPFVWSLMERKENYVHFPAGKCRLIESGMISLGKSHLVRGLFENGISQALRTTEDGNLLWLEGENWMRSPESLELGIFPNDLIFLK